MKMVVTAGLFVEFAVLADAALAAPDDDDAPAPFTETLKGEAAKITCQRVKVVGSLIKKRKICLTSAEWDQLADAAQRNSETLRMGNLGGADGCRVGQPC